MTDRQKAGTALFLILAPFVVGAAIQFLPLWVSLPFGFVTAILYIGAIKSL